MSNYSGGSHVASYFEMSLGHNPGQNIFATIKCNGVTYTSASAGYTWDGSNAQWIWTTGGGFNMNQGTTYPVVFT